MEYVIHKPVSDSKEEDVVNEGDDDIGEVSSTWADETEANGPGDDKFGGVAVDTSEYSVIRFDTVYFSNATQVDGPVHFEDNLESRKSNKTYTIFYW